MGNFQTRLADYMRERYDETLASKAHLYEKVLKDEDAVIVQNDYGFVTFNLNGDSVILYDMYVEPQYRSTGKGWTLLDIVLRVANGFKKKCIITFSEKTGKNHNLGVRAMQGAGFVPYGETFDDYLYIRGV